MTDGAEAWCGDIRHVTAIMAAVRADARPFHGLRVVPEGGAVAPRPGDVLAPSMLWEGGAPTRKRLKGTAALTVRRAEDAARAIRASGRYPGTWVALVGADERRPGESDGHCLLTAPVVLAVWARRDGGAAPDGGTGT